MDREAERSARLAADLKGVADNLEADGCCHAMSLQMALFGASDVFGDVMHQPITTDELILLLRMGETIFADQAKQRSR